MTRGFPGADPSTRLAEKRHERPPGQTKPILKTAAPIRHFPRGSSMAIVAFDVSSFHAFHLTSAKFHLTSATFHLTFDRFRRASIRFPRTFVPFRGPPFSSEERQLSYFPHILITAETMRDLKDARQGSDLAVTSSWDRYFGGVCHLPCDGYRLQFHHPLPSLTQCKLPVPRGRSPESRCNTILETPVETQWAQRPLHEAPCARGTDAPQRERTRDVPGCRRLGFR